MDSYQKKLNEMKAAREQAQARSNNVRAAPATGPLKSTSSPSVNSLANKTTPTTPKTTTTPTVSSSVNSINRTPTTLTTSTTPKTPTPTVTSSVNSITRTPTLTTPTTPTTPTPTSTPTPTPTTPTPSITPIQTPTTPSQTNSTPVVTAPKSASFRGTSPAALGLGQLPKPPGSPGGGSFRGKTTIPLNNNNNNNNNLGGSDFKSLYENEVKQRMLIEEELKALKASSSSESNAVRELNLLKTEVKVNNMKLESEIRKRETLERELASSKEEIKTLKENAAKSQSNQPAPSATAAKTTVTARPGQTIPGSGPTRADSGPQKGNVVRASRRQTRVGGAGGPAAQSGQNIVQMITRVLDEMQKLEGNIKKAEAGRMRAEGELLEVAMYKQASDDALEALVTDSKAIHAAILENNNLLSTYMNSCAPDVRESLGNFVGKFAKLADDLSAKLENAKTPVKTEEVNKRVTIMATKLNIPPPPPMAPTIPMNNTPRPPPPPGSGPTRAPTSVRGDRNSTARASTLLDQIRKGKNLNKIDLETIQRDRENQVSGNRKSMALLASLQETLRAALNARQDDMNLYDEEDEEDWY